eukprot:4818288-Amphidinium_carterae.1
MMFASVLGRPWVKGLACGAPGPLNSWPMAYGGPAGDPQVTADLNTVRIWQRRLNAGKLQWPLEERAWDTALAKGRGRGPIRRLPRVLAAEVAAKQRDFAGLETGLSTQAYRHLKKSSARVEFGMRSEPTVFLLLVITDLCVRCKEEVEDLSHILFRCPPHWQKERRQVELPVDDVETPVRVNLHGLLPAPWVPVVISQDAAKTCVDGSDKHSSGPQHRRCGVGYYTDTQERAWLPLPGIEQSVYRAEFLAV